MLVGFLIQQGLDVITLNGTPPEQIPWKWGARALVFGLIIAAIILVRFSRRLRGEVANNESGND